MRKIAIAAVAATLLSAMPAQAEQFVNVLTGGTSGVYYPMGVALSKIYADNIPDVRPAVQSTKASAENLNLLQQGRGEVGLALGDSVDSAWKGDADAGFAKPLGKLRGLAAIYPNYIQIVARADSNINSLADLKGKRVSVGAPKSGTELNARAIFGANGISYDDFEKTEYLPFGESVQLIQNRQLDATLISAGLGVAAIRDLSSNTEITIVPVTAEEVAKIGVAVIQPAVIPANTYTGQTTDVPTASIINFLITHEDVPEDLVYQMTKSMFENLDQLAAAHSAGKAITLAGALTGMPLPLHPGAQRYYTEKGVK